MKKEWTKKLLALALSLVVAVTFVPLLGDSVFAEGEGDGEGVNPDQVEVNVDEPALGEGDDVDVTDDDPEVTAPAETDVVENEETVNEEDSALPETKDAVEDETFGGGNASHIYIPALLGEGAGGDSDLKSASTRSIDPSLYSVTISQSGNTVTVKGSINSNYRFVNLYVDTTKDQTFTKTSGTWTVNMSNYNTGYHTVTLGVAKKSDTSTLVDLVGARYMVSNNITETPNYNGRFYYVYSNYIDYYPFNFGCNLGSYNLYMELSPNGGKTWSRTGYMKANAIKLYMDQGYTFRGLSANRNYKTRLRYGEYVTYSTDYAGDGKSYFFGGPVRNLGTIKTGAAQKPKIKSIKVKAVKVKRHKVRHYGYYTGVYLYTEKFYTYKLKVTVKLKKKPGTGGLWINGKFAKGNKKKYTVTLPGSSYSVKKPKGKKFTVSVCSYQSSSYGGLSPLYQKKKKIK